jgi:hypothetical protein
MPTDTWTAKDAAGHASSATVSYTVSSPLPAGKVLGMSAPANLWAQRISEVGANGIRARRIFCDPMTSDGRAQASVIQQAADDGMIPVVSYKFTSIASAIAGSYDAWCTATANFLQSLGVPVRAVLHHEPRGDMTPAQFVAMQERLAPLMKRPLVKVGPLLNGFLLTGSTAQQNEWPTWSNDNLLHNIWDFAGQDTYEQGTATSPGQDKPQDRLAPMKTWLAAHGVPNLPIVIGEYNGWSATTITDATEAWIADPNVEVALLFNSDTGAKGVILTGSMLTAFKTKKADPRVLQ